MRANVSILLVFVLISTPLMAGPADPVVVSGQADFQQSGSDWTVTTGGPKTVINWGQFGVDAGATVAFVQPDAAASVLNRVTGPLASRIDGLLTSNGALYLINPHGILIGKDGIVRAAGFVASTLALTDAAYLSGDALHLEGASEAAVENLGTIEAIDGDVHLIARRVVNRGAISAARGSVNLLAGTEILLTEDHEIYVRPDLSAEAGGVGIDNSGVIEALRARLEASGNLYALAINNSGVVRADGSSVVDGRVVLRGAGGTVVNSGTLAARTERADGAAVGGEICVSGDEVAVADGARIDASGPAGGGRVFVGGRDAATADARNTTLAAGAVIAADALDRGDGGSVRVLAQDATDVGGRITARGAGAGGFVETSGGSLAVSGTVSCGLGGTWLLDPTDMVIGDAEAAALVAALDAGTNVSVTTPAAGTDPGDIFVNSAIIKTTDTGQPILLLGAYNGVAINADIDVGPGALWVIALANGVAQAPGTSVQAAELYLKGAGTFDLGQPGNDFGTLAAQVIGDLNVQDATDLTIGNVADIHGLSSWGGRVDLFTPNGHIFANGVFDTPVVRGYHSVGDVELVETSWQSQTYHIQVTTGTNSRPAVQLPPAVEGLLSLQAGALAGLDPATTEGSGVLVEFDPELIGDALHYGWNYKTREAFDTAFGQNDYSFVTVSSSDGATIQVLADVQDVAAAAKQDDGLGLFFWQTGLAAVDTELDHASTGYALGFGVMDVGHTRYMSALYLTDIDYQGHVDTGFELLRIYDHVEDFPHLRPDERVVSVGPEPLGPALEETSAFFDATLQATDPRYWYQSVGSIYQIPR
jgi:filamentous hemagglutinin family protein